MLSYGNIDRMTTLTVGQRIRTLRIARGLTLQGLAALVGSNKGTLSRVERGERELRVSGLERVASALSVDPSALVPAPSRKSGKR